MFPRQLTILGVGLLGGSIGLALRSAAPKCRIVGYGHRRQTLDKALEIGAVDAVEIDPAVAGAGSDLVILCTPVGIFESLLKQIGPSLSAGTMVTDVGSTKRSVVRLAESILPERRGICRQPSDRRQRKTRRRIFAGRSFFESIVHPDPDAADQTAGDGENRKILAIARHAHHAA